MPLYPAFDLRLCYAFLPWRPSLPRYATSQFTSSHFRFNALCPAALYYATSVFLLGISFQSYSFLICTLTFFRNASREYKRAVCVRARARAPVSTLSKESNSQRVFSHNRIFGASFLAYQMYRVGFVHALSAPPVRWRSGNIFCNYLNAFAHNGCA